MKERNRMVSDNGWAYWHCYGKYYSIGGYCDSCHFRLRLEERAYHCRTR